MLQAKKEADRVFSEKQRLKAQRDKEERKKSQAFNAEQMVMLKPFPSHLYIMNNYFRAIANVVLLVYSLKCRLKKVPGNIG